ncbi:hypothetical protein B0H17DRAFT_1146480 [Mycena rosella]|uniref:Uncharacterized protein n=1 Tax=Mycena rosella TaxID=1033263 RepID=A0AAD7CRD4_MYCRO|nr:hypothetical protein B0H17DRAFT_1146480 [Mycena rosella]
MWHPARRRAEVLGSTTSARECRAVDGATRTRADWCPVNCSIRPTVVAPEAAASSDGCRLLEIHHANTSRGPVATPGELQRSDDHGAGPKKGRVAWIVEMAIGEGRVVEFDRRSGENGSVAGLENKGKSRGGGVGTGGLRRRQGDNLAEP